MAAFRVWCRAENVGPDQFLAVVTAIPEAPVDRAPRPESESRLVTSQVLAHDACAQMVASLRQRIERRGDTVTRVDFV